MEAETIVYNDLSYTSFTFQFYNGVTVTIGIEEGDTLDMGYISPLGRCMKCCTFNPNNYTFVSIERSIPLKKNGRICSSCKNSFEGYEPAYIRLRNIVDPLRVFLGSSSSDKKIILINGEQVNM